MKLEKLDHMKYLDGMDIVDSNIMMEVLRLVKEYDYHKFTSVDVEKALLKSQLSIYDYAAILSPAAMPYLEHMAKKAMSETRKHFGNSVCIFTPLYIANYCENECVYCGFNCKNKIHRGKLSLEEIEYELKEISSTGLKEILILTGESRQASGIEYIGDAVKLAANYFSTIGIEIYPLNIDEYSYLHDCGADFVSVYQETYNTEMYEQVHLKGPKRIFPYRFNSQERALLGGMRGVAFGALLGLDDFRKDAFAAGLHALFVQQKYPHAEISFSTPRLRPYINDDSNISENNIEYGSKINKQYNQISYHNNNSNNNQNIVNSNPNEVHEKQLLQVMLAYRLLMPFAGITISTRENARFRDNVIGMTATKISAGVCVGVGGHKVEEKGDEQFEISDPRSVKEIHQMLIKRELQPVYSDYTRV